MKPLSQLVRPNIQALQPYSTARDEYAGGGIDVWLDANESPYDNGVNRYPDPHQRALKALIAELKGVDAGRIFIGNGSDEAIDLAFRIFCRPGLDNAVSIAPDLRDVPRGGSDERRADARSAARSRLLAPGRGTAGGSRRAHEADVALLAQQPHGQCVPGAGDRKPAPPLRRHRRAGRSLHRLRRRRRGSCRGWASSRT